MIWKNINDKYKVSDTGLIKRISGNFVDKIGRVKYYEEKILNPRPGRTGYMRVTLEGKDYYVHRLVAQAFIDNPLNKPEVNHKDGNKKNNEAARYYNNNHAIAAAGRGERKSASGFKWKYKN